MKTKLNLLLVAIIALSFSACSKKTVTQVKPYESFYTNQAAKKKIVFNGVTDLRRLPIISYIIKNNIVVAKFLMNQDVKSWYNNAYMREFHASDIMLDQNQRDPKSTIVEIHIKELKAEYYSSILTDANLKGIVSLEIVLRKKNKIVKKIINSTQSEFKLSIRDAEGFEKFIYGLMAESVSKSVKIIIDTMKTL